MHCYRIFSEKGLPHVEKEFPKLKFKGKGHEVSSLNTDTHYKLLCGGDVSCSFSVLRCGSEIL